MQSQSQFSNLQLELLKVFSFDLNEQQLVDIRKLLSEYFSTNISAEMDRLWGENNWSEETMRNWSQEHLRKQQD